MLGIRTLFDSPCVALSSSAAGVQLQLAASRIESTLLLAADGSHSWVRGQLNMAMQQKPYQQTAVVANFIAANSHQNIARQWFSQNVDGDLGVLAWLPLPDNKISIVWSVSNQYAAHLLSLSVTDFSATVMAAGCAVLGDMQLITPAAAFALNLQTSNTLAQHGVVLVGDAAHQIHPMAGQGVNLGFRDVVDLVKTLNEKPQYQSIQDKQLLAHYARLRKADTLNLVMLTDGLFKLFASKNAAVKTVRNWGLTATNQQLIKKMLVQNAIAL